METNNPIKYFLLAFNKYADFRGRSRRREYWYFVLCQMIISMIFDFATSAVQGRGEHSLVTAISFIQTIYVIAIFIPSISVSVRRLHDINRSGWWILVPIVNIVFFCFDSDPQTNRFGPSPKPREGMPQREEGIVPEAGASSDDFDKIEKLARLRDQGVLTEEEFQRKKKELL